mgnify:CR=1 FL=1
MPNPEKLNLLNDARSLVTDTITSGLICAVFGKKSEITNENKQTTYSYFSDSNDGTFSFKVCAEYPPNHDSFNPAAIYIREIEYGIESTNYYQYYFKSVGRILFRPYLDIDIDVLNLSDDEQQSILIRSLAWSTN